MKKFVKFTIHEPNPKGTPIMQINEICGRTLPSEDMKQLRERWPQFFPPDLVGFHLEAELGDPVIEEVISYLRTTGREPYWKRFPTLPWEHPTFYQIKGERVWELSDFDNASYFCWVFGLQAGSGRKLPPDGRFEVEHFRNKPIGRMDISMNPFCTSEFRQELESQNFAGLSFRPVKVSFRTREKNYSLWQVWSTITLPPVLDHVVGSNGEPFDPATSTYCGIDDLYSPRNYRFPASEVAKLEPFDIALTTEFWGNAPTHRREADIIVSRRFRDWFMTQNVDVEWWPVALE